MTAVKLAELIFACFMLLHGKAGRSFDYLQNKRKEMIC